MTLAARLPAPLRDGLYRAQQSGWKGSCIAIQNGLRRTIKNEINPSAEQIAIVERRRHALIDLDLENVRSGLYPADLLFQIPFGAYARCAPSLVLDMPRILRRRQRKDYRDLPRHVDVKRYPPYFRRTFHWQTDGYLSERSANIYDLGVEFLFLGMADVMRRQVIPPISRFAGDRGKDLRILDVGTGTGRALAQLARAHPTPKYYGIDLSPYYLRHARSLLHGVEHLSLVADNAEEMPFADATFDVLTSVYLFHELPRAARRNVYREMARVLRPGGLVVIQDSAQASESPDLAFEFAVFAEDFHEPFHREYVSDPIESALEETGMRVESVTTHYLSKTVVARKA